MGYDHYFINETKKQIVGTKALYMDYEDGQQLLSYLRCCEGDTIRIVGENNSLILAVMHPDPSQRNYEYKYIQLHSFSIHKDNEGQLPEIELDRLFAEVTEQ